jgi:nucleoside-diphosphate-sugar epimerase
LKENFRDLKVEHSPAQACDFKGVLVDSDKAQRLLGWKPKTKFKVGLEKYIDLVRRRRTGP